MGEHSTSVPGLMFMLHSVGSFGRLVLGSILWPVGDLDSFRVEGPIFECTVLRPTFTL